MTAIPFPPMGPNLPIPNSRFSEQHLERPLHRARSARADDGVTAIDVRSRSNLPERAAPHTGTEETTQIDAIGHFEDLPARLKPRVPLQLELCEDVEIELREHRPASAVPPARAELPRGWRGKRLRGVRDRRSRRRHIGIQIAEIVV